MTRVRPAPAAARHGAAHAVGLPRWLGLVAVALLGLLVFGGYAMHWAWTGLSGNVTLWDWLQVLALPVALGAVPLLLEHRQRLTPRHRTSLVGVLGAFAALVLAGYLVPLSWTGFTGNTLWDWLELILLPLVVAIASFWPARRPWRRAQITVGAVAGIAFVVLATLGYLVPLTWTGFRGNTLWDWVKLLLLPVLVPTLLLPLVTERLKDRLAPPDARTADRVVSHEVGRV